MSGKILQRPELAGGATVNGEEVINSEGAFVGSIADTLAEGSIYIGNSSNVTSELSIKSSGRILVGSGTTAASVAVSGDATLSSAGALTIAAGAVTNAKVADTTGAAGLALRKSAIVVYDFAVDGGVAGTIALTGAPTIPDNAAVWVESYDVITTCTSASDAATIALQLPVDGVLTTAIAISNGSNPWDAGVFAAGKGGLATPLPKKCTAARVPSLLVAGGENLTAGKIIFQLAYWVSA